jgi:DNA-binding response OmpR family regulator
MAAHRIILFLHRDDLLARTLTEPLAGQGFELLPATSLEQALEQADRAELLLLDASADPASLCPQLREEGVAAPILLLAGLSTPEIMEADERIQKPVRIAQLAARIQALLERPLPPESLIRFGDLALHPIARLVETAEGRRIPLTEKETAILLHLHQAGGADVGRDELLETVWGYVADVSTHTVETHIYRLRRKLGEGSVLTGSGGYRLGA